MAFLARTILHFYQPAIGGLDEMPTITRYGSTDKILFKITSSGNAVTSAIFQAADVRLSKNGSASWTNIGSAITEFGYGMYYWTPASAGMTQCKEGVINIADASGGVFDENCIIFHTYGDSNSRYPEFS